MCAHDFFPFLIRYAQPIYIYHDQKLPIPHKPRIRLGTGDLWISFVEWYDTHSADVDANVFRCHVTPWQVKVCSGYIAVSITQSAFKVSSLCFYRVYHACIVDVGPG